YAWGLAVFRLRNVALFVAAITLFNQLLYVQARIAMLDTFMFGFLVWAMAAFCAGWSTQQKPGTLLKLHAFSGVFFGLAIACKWSAMVPWLFCSGLILLVWLLRYWGVTFS